MIELAIPDSHKNIFLNSTLLTLKNSYPDKFYDDISKVIAYGCPEGCTWNGNRYNPGDCSYGSVENLMFSYEMMNVKYRLTFSNSRLEDADFYDRRSNMVAKVVSERGGNGAIVSTEKMASFLNENYPGLYLVNSITTPNLKTVDDINKLSKDRITVIPPQFINNEEVLKQLEHPENIEIIVNETCPPDCPKKYTHWEWLCDLNLHKPCLKWECPREDNENSLVEELNNSPFYVTRDNLPLYEKYGINKFKISGRLDPELELIGIKDWFVKPEYRDWLENLLITEGIMVRYDDIINDGDES